jgi:hypothetical protein
MIRRDNEINIAVKDTHHRVDDKDAGRHDW